MKYIRNASFEGLANPRRIGALHTIRDLHPDFVSPIQILFILVKKKKNEKFFHENEGKNRRPKRAPIVRGAKAGANYAEFGT